MERENAINSSYCTTDRETEREIEKVEKVDRQEITINYNHLGNKMEGGTFLCECLFLNCPLLCLSPDYDVNFFKQFTLVLNALDNRGE